MPWKECNIVEERLRFIARLLDGDKMAGLTDQSQRHTSTHIEPHYRRTV